MKMSGFGKQGKGPEVETQSIAENFDELLADGLPESIRAGIQYIQNNLEKVTPSMARYLKERVSLLSRGNAQEQQRITALLNRLHNIENNADQYNTRSNADDALPTNNVVRLERSRTEMEERLNIFLEEVGMAMERGQPLISGRINEIRKWIAPRLDDLMKYHREKLEGLEELLDEQEVGNIRKQAGIK